MTHLHSAEVDLGLRLITIQRGQHGTTKSGRLRGYLVAVNLTGSGRHPDMAQRHADDEQAPGSSHACSVARGACPVDRAARQHWRPGSIRSRVFALGFNSPIDLPGGGVVLRNAYRGLESQDEA